jgi:tripartite motif-containing protein 71
VAKKVGSFGSKGWKSSSFIEPMGIAIGPNGNLVVCDRGNHRVQIFSTEKELPTIVTVIGSTGVPSSSNGFFNEPSNVAIDSNNIIYITDTRNHRVQIFRDDGIWLQSFGSFGSGNGEFFAPWGISVTSGGERIYVSDYDLHNVQVFNGKGQFEQKFGNRNGYLRSPSDLTLTQQNCFLVVCEHKNHRLLLLNALDGSLIKIIGSKGRGDCQFEFPIALTLNGNDSELAITDYNNRRVQIFEHPDFQL